MDADGGKRGIVVERPSDAGVCVEVNLGPGIEEVDFSTKDLGSAGELAEDDEGRGVSGTDGGSDSDARSESCRSEDLEGMWLFSRVKLGLPSGRVDSAKVGSGIDDTLARAA